MRFISRGSREAEGAPKLGRFQESFKQVPNASWGAGCRGATRKDMGPCCHGRWMGQGRTCHQKPEEDVVWRRGTGGGGSPRAREQLHCDLLAAHPLAGEQGQLWMLCKQTSLPRQGAGRARDSHPGRPTW